MKRYRLNLNLTSVIVIIAAGVLLPVLLSTAVGIVSIVLARDVGGIVFGVLVLSFAVTAMGGALVTVVLMGRKARLARRQADFLAGVSHEFRTPLSAIKLYAQTIQSGRVSDDPEGMRHCVGTILREVERMDVLIDRVLTWRASSKDMLPLNLEACPLGPAVHEAVERFRSMVPADEITLTTTINTSLAVFHDVRAIGSVVVNLLENAYKYTGTDKRIEVRVRDEQNAVIVDVVDNGTGVSAYEAERIFQPFYRAANGHGETSGVGLGLSIARHLVERHGGTIGVAGRKGHGTTFSIRLPAANDEAS